MRAAPWFIGGLAVGVAYVLIMGISTVQIAAARGGVVVDLRNEVVEVGSPSTPILQWFVSAVLGVLTFYAIVLHPRRRDVVVRVAAAGGFVVAALALSAWSLAIDDDAASEAVSAGTALGWKGWIQEGGTNAAVHLMIGLAILAIMRALADRSEAVKADPWDSTEPGSARTGPA